MIGVQCLTGKSPNQLQEDPQTGEILWRSLAQVSQPTAQFIDTMIRDHFSQRYPSAIDALKALDQVRSQRRPKPEPNIELEPKIEPEPPTVYIPDPVYIPLKPKSALERKDSTPKKSRRGFLTLLGIGGLGLGGSMIWGLQRNPYRR